jgi:hypothetical protein
MQEILFGYNLDPTTWAYVSSLMVVGIYFKFRRFWSVRNLDLVALIAFAPGFLLIYHGLVKDHLELVPGGYLWLFAVSGFFLIRLLLDPVMVRRPLLEPNLSASGLTFTGVCLLVFLMANVVTTPKERLETELTKLTKAEAPVSPDPGSLWFHVFADFSRPKVGAPNAPRTNGDLLLAATHAMVILSHLAVVAGMVWIGYRHFDNIHTGAAAATLYLLTFYTSQLTSQIDHVAPAAILVWAIAAYRRPLFSGVLIGLAGGLIYYPLFLLPLWCGFYWRRGFWRFSLGVVATLAILVAVLAVNAGNANEFLAQFQLMFGWRNPFVAKLAGFWRYYDPVYRIPVLAAFVALCGGLAIWPAQKNLGTLLSCSAAVMLASQFWHAQQGGLRMGWYLPLLILTIFRPNLEDRVALSAVRPAWGLWRRKTT